MEMKIDKSNWRTVKLIDVFTKKEENDKENARNRFDRFLKVNHFDAESLHIKRWASQEKGEELNPTFYKIFRKGQILFPTRNPHLRRTVLASFDGICGEKTLTLEPNEEFLIPEFIPFLFHSESFYAHTTGAIIGSTNPHCRWRDVANYEFLLPPKDQQAKLAELLWAMDEVIEKKYEFKLKANQQYEVAKSNLVLKGINKATEFSEILKRDVAKNWKTTTIGDLLKDSYILKIQDGNHGEIHPKSSDYVDMGIPFIMANTLIDGEIDFEKSKKLPKEVTDRLRIGFAQANDILLSHKGTVGEVAMVPKKIDYPYLMLTPQVTFYRINPDKLLNKFLYYVFNASYFQIQIERLSSQSTRAYVGITSQRGFKLAIPNSIEEQQEIVDVLSKVEENRKKIDSSISSSKALQKSLINQVF
jgi:type I restriction enzyme S subunit